MPRYGVNRKKLIRLEFEDGKKRELRMTRDRLGDLIDRDSYRALRYFCEAYGLRHRWRRIVGNRYELTVTGFNPIRVENNVESEAHKLALLKLHRIFLNFPKSD